ncbi:hypothetical protein [Rathayibacter sp. VKM Ac-2857]|uniref:hypothetical protein n=1 Tax=Rathayibacter sp. VKM Ac-2857 TaxID=2739020 RepID=UPI0015665756|nr:hypothetical protein [Rathayibacter sp. VKM Ac-2857]NQX15088.1 hypothetical protein [Rathayibacter sp. VKM Ac-2857]
MALDVDVVNDWLDYWTFGATLLVAAVTAASAVIIAIQSKHTKDSARASLAAVTVAQRALDESVRVRLDARAPRYEVVVAGVDMRTLIDTGGVPLAKIRTSQPFAPQAWAIADFFPIESPQDNHFLLAKVVCLTLTNYGPAVTLRCSHAVNEGHANLSDDFGPLSNWMPKHLSLPALGEKKVSVLIVHSVAEWMELREAGVSEQSARIVFSYVGPNDADVDLSTEVVVTGSAVDVLTFGERKLSVRVGGLQAEALPTKVTYWRSRAQRLLLDSR